MKTRLSLNRMLARTGGRYMLIVLAVTQVVSLLGAIPGILSIQVNAQFDAAQQEVLNRVLPFLLLASIAILFGFGWWITTAARKRLDAWKEGVLKPDSVQELAAWKQITGLDWRYGLFSIFVFSLVVILPFFLISLSFSGAVSSPFQPASQGSPIPVYVLFGGTAAMLGAVIFAILIIERLMLPARLVLLPTDFETQLMGRSGTLLRGKFVVLILGLLTIAILLIAPIGYQYTMRILYADVSSWEVFQGFQLQSIIFSLLAFVLGVGFAYAVSQSISNPIEELIVTFNKIEQGDLTQRARVSATDELGVVTVQFNRMVARLESLQTTLEQQVAERTRQLSATNEVARAASSSLDPNELIKKVVDLFSEEFGYYYAAIYLLDPSERWAELEYATGEAGRVLKQNRHRLEVPGRSMVATCIQERNARIAQIAAQEPQRYENPLLPYTRSEIALPLIAGDRVIGALNVQSTREADFGPQVIETMQNMGSQVAIALENARLFQEAQVVIREMQAVQQQYLIEGWDRFSSENESMEYIVGDEIPEESERMEVNINLRDQILGQITLEGRKDWTFEQQTLVDAVARQAAIALENARLVQESHQVAVRERMLAEINSKIWSAATIDGVLQTVVKELGRRFDASQASIELALEDSQESDPPPSNGKQ
jgi:GAF domain-containing protein/HAMP domain-containing protein